MKKNENSRQVKTKKVKAVIVVNNTKGALSTAVRKKAFLENFSQVGVISSAARLTGIDRTTHDRWMLEDADYNEAFKQAIKNVQDKLEQELIHRGVEGDEVPVFGKDGEITGYKTQKSDACLIFALKGWLPEKYRERIDVKGEHLHLHAVRIIGTESLDNGAISRVLEEIARPTGGESVAHQEPPSGTDPA